MIIVHDWLGILVKKQAFKGVTARVLYLFEGLDRSVQQTSLNLDVVIRPALILNQPAIQLVPCHFNCFNS